MHKISALRAKLEKKIYELSLEDKFTTMEEMTKFTGEPERSVRMTMNNMSGRSHPCLLSEHVWKGKRYHSTYWWDNRVEFIEHEIKPERPNYDKIPDIWKIVDNWARCSV